MKPKYIIFNLAIIISTVATVFFINSLLQIPSTDVDTQEAGPGFYFHDIPDEVIRRDQESRKKGGYTEAFNDIYNEGNYFSQDDIESTTAQSDSTKDQEAVIVSQKVVSIEQNLSSQDKMEILKIMTKVPAKETLKIIAMMRDGITKDEQNEMYYLLQDKIGQGDLDKLIKILQGYVES